MSRKEHNTPKHPYQRANLQPGQSIIVTQQSRNEPCKCGSGKKAKKCCGTEKEITAIYQNPKKERPKPMLTSATGDQKTLVELAVGDQIKSLYFEGTTTVEEIDEPNNILKVRIESLEAGAWNEAWNLEHTIIGIQQGVYTFTGGTENE